MSPPLLAVLCALVSAAGLIGLAGKAPRRAPSRSARSGPLRRIAALILALAPGAALVAWGSGVAVLIWLGATALLGWAIAALVSSGTQPQTMPERNDRPGISPKTTA